METASILHCVRGHLIHVTEDGLIHRHLFSAKPWLDTNPCFYKSADSFLFPFSTDLRNLSFLSDLSLMLHCFLLIGVISLIQDENFPEWLCSIFKKYTFIKLEFRALVLACDVSIWKSGRPATPPVYLTRGTSPGLKWASSLGPLQGSCTCCSSHWLFMRADSVCFNMFANLRYEHMVYSVLCY